MIIAELNNQVKAKINQQLFRKIIQKAGSVLKIKKNSLVSVALVNKMASQKLNAAYRGINRPTDVLSFAAVKLAGRQEKNYLGEIIICYPLVKKQAKEYGVITQKELARLMVHGLLHLNNYHHQTKNEKRKMEQLTDKILS